MIRPRPATTRGIAIGCGLAPHLSDFDPYLMALAAIDEGLRNVVCVGGDPRRTAILDNFCWGRTDDPQMLGALVRACQACYDAAIAYGTPFISGKDSLNNEFALDARDVDATLAQVEHYVRSGFGGEQDYSAAAWSSIADRVRRTNRLAIPHTLLISAVALVDDVQRCVTPDLKTAGDSLLLVGGFDECGVHLARATAVHASVADAITAGLVAAAHDVSDGGWLVAAAEMAFGGQRGVRLDLRATQLAPEARCIAGYLIEARDADRLGELLSERGISSTHLGVVSGDDQFRLDDAAVSVADLRAAWGHGPGA